MTQRYAHFRDEALKQGDGQIDDIFTQQAGEDAKVKSASVINQKKNRCNTLSDTMLSGEM